MSVPYGAITPFAGEVDAATNYEREGWYLCDGRSLDHTKYPHLYAVLGVLFGGDGAPDFNLPDLRGMFLRGVDNGTGRDPDAGERYLQGQPSVHPPEPTGTWQDPEFHRHNHHLTGAWEVARNEGSDLQAMSNDPGSGGDAGYTDSYSGEMGPTSEVRPKNVSVNWLIQGDLPEGGRRDDSAILAGTVLAIAMTSADVRKQEEESGWYLCDGRSLEVSKFRALQNVIGYLYGQPTDPEKFFIPDYQGVFLRAQDMGAGRDPDAAARWTQGNSKLVMGDKVGSWQDDALLEHQHGLSGSAGCVDTNGQYVYCPSNGSGYDDPNGGWTDESGGNETRPKNVAVNFVINTAPTGEAEPG